MPGLHFSSAKVTWNTPEWLCAIIQKFYPSGFLDPAADSEAPHWTGSYLSFTEKEDGLQQLWEMPVYLNPPYGHDIGFWTRKFAAEWRSRRMVEGLLLLPARIDTRWWRELLSISPLIYFFYGRLTFSHHQNAAPFPSALLFVGSERRSQELADKLLDKAWVARPLNSYRLGPGLTNQQAKGQNPEAFKKSQHNGGVQTALARKDEKWLHSSVEDFRRWLEERKE